MNYRTIRNTIKDMARSNYKELVKAIISVEKGIDDENILNDCYETYMKDDTMALLNDEIDSIIAG